MDGVSRAASRVLGHRGAVVLLYHRVADLPVDPWGLVVSPAHFAEHLDILSRFARTVQARELAGGLGGRSLAAGVVAVTFDDGYADFASTVQPLLARADVPATMFAVSGAIGSKREFWWDELERAILTTWPVSGALHLTIGGLQRRWNVSDPPFALTRLVHRAAGRLRVYKQVWKVLHGLDADARARVMDEIVEWAGIRRSPRQTHRSLSPEELANVTNDLVEVGAHTVNHPSLAALPIYEQRREIEVSRAELSAAVGYAIESFAYPFGSRTDYSPKTVELVRAAGFRCAFTNIPGRVTARSNRFEIPRVFVTDVDGDGLGRTLRRVAGIRVG